MASVVVTSDACLQQQPCPILVSGSILVYNGENEMQLHPSYAEDVLQEYTYIAIKLPPEGLLSGPDDYMKRLLYENGITLIEHGAVEGRF